MYNLNYYNKLLFTHLYIDDFVFYYKRYPFTKLVTMYAGVNWSQMGCRRKRTFFLFLAQVGQCS